MPLIHATSRGSGPGGGGGSDSSSEHRRSVAEIIGLDTLLLKTQRGGHHGDMNGNSNGKNGDFDWLWNHDQPSSPEAAQSPRALVPPKCFPSRHPRDYASFSESARPVHSWGNDNAPSAQGITDLVASMKALALPEPAPRNRLQSYSQTIHLRVSCDQPGTGWSPEVNTSDTFSGCDEARVLPRRASFCGVVTSSRKAVRWEGNLPPRCPDPTAGVSPKVFLGGLPWDITEQSLMQTLRNFQPVRVEWPEREIGGGAGGSPRGFAYVTFESERRVRALLSASRREGNNLYYRVQSRKMRTKDAQVIPWCVSDASWVGCGSARLEPKRTVFVGALHGMMSAAALASIMDDLFPGVVYAGIDTDKNKYPIGSGRVTFNNLHSYIRAISAGFVEIITDKFTKRVQVLPYLEDSMCSVCNLQQGPYFCRDPTCYRYFCRSCWTWQHPNEEHKPLMRNSKSQPLGYIAHPHNGNTGARHSPPSDQGSVNTVYNGNLEGTTSVYITHPHNGNTGARHSPPSDQGSVNTVYNGNMEGTTSVYITHPHNGNTGARHSPPSDQGSVNTVYNGNMEGTTSVYITHPHNGNTGARHSSPSDQGSVNTVYNGNLEGTPSPPMSGSSYEPVTGSSPEEPDQPLLWSSLQ